MQDLFDVHFHDLALQSVLEQVSVKKVPISLELVKRTHALCFTDASKVRL